MKFSQVFASRFLRAEDIPDGAPVKAIIAGVTKEEVGKKAETKYVLSFRNSTLKPLVLNKTNASTIAGAYGDDSSDWTGRPLLVYATETNFGGEVVPCIRVKIPKGGQPVQPPAPLEDEEVECPI